MKNSWLAAGLAAFFVAALPAAVAPQLKYVVVISRHGVRAPTWELSRLNEYSAEPWPEWGVPPGDLTAHGRASIISMGGYYHDWFASEHLIEPAGCQSAARIYIWADKDQRTLETGRALGESLVPGCEIPTHSAAGNQNDPIFSGWGDSDPQLALDAVRARLGSDPAKLLLEHQAALRTLQSILGGGRTLANDFVAANREVGVVVNGKSVALRGPFDTSSTLSEDLLLEYTNGMQTADLGWGRLTRENLLQVLELHGTYADLMRRTPYLARVRGSNLLAHVLRSMEQAVSGTSVAGSLGRPDDSALIIVGHDTNQSNLSGMLDMNWKLPGYPPDETPPGGALIFSLWRTPDSPGFFVKSRFVAQSLDQMRNAAPLTLASPPEAADILIPACKSAQQEQGCPWPVFEQALQAAIDPAFTRE